MTEVLLKELSTSDIDWMIATGRQREIAAGTVLLQEGKARVSARKKVTRCDKEGK